MLLKEGNLEIRGLIVDLKIRIDYVNWTLFLPAFKYVMELPHNGLRCSC